MLIKLLLHPLLSENFYFHYTIVLFVLTKFDVSEAYCYYVVTLWSIEVGVHQNFFFVCGNFTAEFYFSSYITLGYFFRFHLIIEFSDYVDERCWRRERINTYQPLNCWYHSRQEQPDFGKRTKIFHGFFILHSCNSRIRYALIYSYLERNVFIRKDRGSNIMFSCDFNFFLRNTSSWILLLFRRRILLSGFWWDFVFKKKITLQLSHFRNCYMSCYI